MSRRRKITEQQEHEIRQAVNHRRRMLLQLSNKALGRQYGVSSSLIQKISDEKVDFRTRQGLIDAARNDRLRSWRANGNED